MATSTERYAQVARLVGPGEWTTYGDVAAATLGDSRAGLSVGRAASTPNFPNPHRLLRASGLIPEQWRDVEGRGPAECRRLLESEGVRFIGDKADPACRVTSGVLLARLKAAPG
jgi:alkylated DNA nucleotide flippase Atl1